MFSFDNLTPPFFLRSRPFLVGVLLLSLDLAAPPCLLHMCGLSYKFAWACASDLILRPRLTTMCHDIASLLSATHFLWYFAVTLDPYLFWGYWVSY